MREKNYLARGKRPKQVSAARGAEPVVLPVWLGSWPAARWRVGNAPLRFCRRNTEPEHAAIFRARLGCQHGPSSHRESLRARAQTAAAKSAKVTPALGAAGVYVSSITYKHLEQLFHMPLDEAATVLGLGEPLSRAQDIIARRL